MPGGPLMDPLNRFELPLFPNMSDLDPANTNCTHGIQWVWIVMGECVMDARGGLALFCGFFCLVMWISTGIPQMVENFRKGIPDQALSPFLLLFWTLGDVCNLVGCILAHQLILQTVISAYSIAADLVLVFQFIYYKFRRILLIRRVSSVLGAGKVSSRSSSTSDLIDTSIQQDESSDDKILFSTSVYDAPTTNRDVQTLAVCFLGFAGITITMVSISSANLFPRLDSITNLHLTTNSPVGRRLLSWVDFKSPDGPDSLDPDFLSSPAAKVGYILGWISTAMYLCSRFPQIYTNWKRKSTEGLCLFMFCMTVMGNTSYGLQIFLTSLERNYLLRAIPWLVGSLGIVAMDIMILIQFYCYRSKHHRRFDLVTTSDIHHE